MNRASRWATFWVLYLPPKYPFCLGPSVCRRDDDFKTRIVFGAEVEVIRITELSDGYTILR
jgi:hypothetical protein